MARRFNAGVRLALVLGLGVLSGACDGDSGVVQRTDSAPEIEDGGSKDTGLGGADGGSDSGTSDGGISDGGGSDGARSADGGGPDGAAGCQPGACPEGQICQNDGRCVDDRCANDDTCPPAEYCDADGACLPGCRQVERGCLEGQICDASHQCVDACSAEEICGNAVDENCDGQLDEGCPPPCEAGAACDTGQPGACAEGAVRCGPDGPSCAPLREAVDEICDTADNDCDGQIDETYERLGSTCFAGTGACRDQGLFVCTAAGGLACNAAPTQPLPERCNALDDDCDGQTDETFEDIGAECSVGTGLCETIGRVSCVNDFTAACDAFPGAVGVELCDDLDNDCDGNVDENFAQKGAPCQSGLGVCAGEGLFECTDDGRLQCVADGGEPSAEDCDGIDNDCDGSIDEGDLLQGCYAGLEGTAGVGQCRGGFRGCVDGGIWGDCVGQILPGVEICDGEDNDCDGLVDEGEAGEPMARDCYDGPDGTGDVGLCAIGRQICADGIWAGCAGQRLPEDEFCDSADNNCDGLIDNILNIECTCEPGALRGCYGGPPGSDGTGECSRGTQRCLDDGETYDACVGYQGPAPEICDGLDNDCDGRTDEGIFGVGAACQVGQGECAAAGVTVCDGPRGVICNAVEGAVAVETCNFVDDDCDGSIDEGFFINRVCSAGVGRCARDGQMRCDLATGESFCNAEPGGPREEICGGIDDDCDGLVDEGLRVGDPCLPGIGACQVVGELVCGAGRQLTCSAEPRPVEPERCDGEDNDCDGRTDEGLFIGEPCEAGVGACQRAGVSVCAENGAVACQLPPVLEVEICDGEDNDCDGAVDENNPGGAERCNTGIFGVCGEGSTLCDGGRIQCVIVGQPAEESCDGLDNDCDGAVDEDFGAGDACVAGDGQCQRAGVLFCDAAGAVQCSALGGGPVAEICNGQDDDCDGQIDEEDPQIGTECAAGDGICRASGQRACVDGALICDAELGAPDGELCNTLDDDCDGVVDEGFLLGERCSAGRGICAREGLRICGPDGAAICDTEPGLPEAEICNDLDDDCDGTVDEGACPDLLAPEVTITLLPGVVDPDQISTIFVQAHDDLAVESMELRINGELRNLNAFGKATFFTQAPGLYAVRATATDAAGNIGEAATTLRVRNLFDDVAPQVALTAPAPHQTLQGQIEVRGTATDAAFFGWTLALSYNAGRSWHEVTTGAEALEDGVLATLDAQLLRPGLLRLRLTAEDASGNSAFAEADYVVPADGAVGEVRVALRDLVIELPEGQLAIERVWDSRDPDSGGLSTGWRLQPFGAEVVESSNGDVMATLPDGRRLVFTLGFEFPVGSAFGEVVFTAPAGERARLELAQDCLPIQLDAGPICALTGNRVQDSVSAYGLVLDGIRYVLDTDAGLLWIEYPTGNTVLVTADQIRAPGGLNYTLERDADGRLTGVADPDGNQVGYQYDSNGDLAAITDPLGRVSRHGYDDTGRLIQVDGPDGQSAFSLSYDATGRLASRADGEGAEHRYIYDADARTVTVQDPAGGATVWTYDAAGRPLSRVDALGGETIWQRDAAGRVSRRITPDGAATQYGYAGESAAPSRITDPLGLEWRLQRDAAGRLTRLTAPDGGATILTYDAAGLLSSYTAPSGAQTRIERVAGHRSALVDAAGARYAVTRDFNGRVGSISGPMGLDWAFDHDGVGHLIGFTDAEGGDHAYAFDDVGRLTGYIGPMGDGVAMDRDALGRLTNLVAPDGTERRFSWDRAGRLLQRTDAAGQRTRFSWSPSGTLTTKVDALDRRTEWRYDLVGQPIGSTDAAGGAWEYTWQAGYLAEVLDPGGALTRYLRDAAGRLSGVDWPDGTQTRLRTDAVGRLLEATNPAGQIQRSYDADGYVATETGVWDIELSYQRDPMGRVTQMTGPDGAIVYRRDAAGRVTQITDPEGAVFTLGWDGRGHLSSATAPGGVVTTYARDEAGRVVEWATQIADDAVVGERYTLDAMGRPTATQRVDGSLSAGRYDARGALVDAVTISAGGVVLNRQTLEYDAVGNRAAVDGAAWAVDALDRPTQAGEAGLQWSATGTLTRITRPDAPVETFGYDGAGRLVAHAQDGRAEVYGYDALDRRVSASGARWVYAGDRPTYEIDADGVVLARALWAPDSGRLLAVRRGGVTRSVATDGDGTVMALFDADGALSANYAYGAFGDPLDAVPEFGYRGWLYDAAAGLYFIRGTAYAPRIGTTLAAQRSVPKAQDVTALGFEAAPTRLIQSEAAVSRPFGTLEAAQLSDLSARGQPATLSRFAPAVATLRGLLGSAVEALGEQPMWRAPIEPHPFGGTEVPGSTGAPTQSVRLIQGLP